MRNLAAAVMLVAASPVGALQFVGAPPVPAGFAFSQGEQVGRLAGGTETGTVEYVAVSLIPEPATWGLLVAGFTLVGTSARRRAQRRI